MADRNRQVLNELLKREGNSTCVDCKSDENIDWASCSLGAFLCQDCAGVHRSLGVDISRVKSIKLDNWDDDQVQKMAECGNNIVNNNFEKYLPMYYRRPGKHDADILRNQFIRAKYQRKEFVYQDHKISYTENRKEGVLMKRGKTKDSKFKSRKFLVNIKDNCIQYFVDQSTTAKETISLEDVNMVFVPEKVGNPNGFQLTYVKKNGKTRNLFLYCDESQSAVDWYTAIRSAKLERRRLAFPATSAEELCKDLTVDFVLEGSLQKRGPAMEGYRKRWFCLERRKLMYLEDKMSPYPKGEVYLGHKDDGYKVESLEGGDECEFVLITPARRYQFKADIMEEKFKWIEVLQLVIDTVPTPQERKLLTAMGASK